MGKTNQPTTLRLPTIQVRPTNTTTNQPKLRNSRGNTMSAHISTAVYAWCNDCADGSEVGISRDEAELWASEHDKLNHSEENEEA